MRLHQEEAEQFHAGPGLLLCRWQRSLRGKHLDLLPLREAAGRLQNDRQRQRDEEAASGRVSSDESAQSRDGPNGRSRNLRSGHNLLGSDLPSGRCLHGHTPPPEAESVRYGLCSDQSQGTHRLLPIIRQQQSQSVSLSSSCSQVASNSSVGRCSTYRRRLRWEAFHSLFFHLDRSPDQLRFSMPESGQRCLRDLRSFGAALRATKRRSGDLSAFENMILALRSAAYFTFSSSTSKISVSFGPIGPPGVPRSP